MKNKRYLIGVFEGDGDPKPDPDPQGLGDPNPTPDPDPDPTPEDWRQSLSEDLRSNELLKDADSLEDFVANALKAPDPIDPQSYKLPETLDSSDFREALAKANVSADGVSEVMKVVNKQQESLAEAEANRRTEGLTKLFAEWGDKKDENLLMGKTLLQKYDDEEGSLANLLFETQAGNEPTVVKFFQRIAKDMVEDGMLTLKDPPPTKNKSAADVLYPNQGKNNE